MELLNSVKATPLLDVLKISSINLKLPIIGESQYSQLSRVMPEFLNGFGGNTIRTSNTEERYIPIDCADPLQWAKFVQEIIINAASSGTGTSIAEEPGVVAIIDCAYQWGSPEMPNTLMSSFKEALESTYTDSRELVDSILNKVVVIDEVEELSDVNKILHNIDAYLQGDLRKLPLKCIIISNLSVFYWGLRESLNFEPMNELHRVCKKASTKYGCYVISSRSKYAT